MVISDGDIPRNKKKRVHVSGLLVVKYIVANGIGVSPKILVGFD